MAGQSFIASVIAAEPMWLWRTIGGLLMVGSHVVFAVNVWAMRPSARRRARCRPGRGQEPRVSFGGLHTDHRAIVAVAIIVFFVLTLVMAVLPALREQAFPTPAGATPRGPRRSADDRSTCARAADSVTRSSCVTCRWTGPYGRPSRPGDYALEDPPMLGTQRTGPDLADVGARQPSETWHLIHLYDPRAVVPQSVMPAYRWYFVEKDQAGPGDVVVPVPADSAPRGKVIVAGPDAKALVRYLLSLKQAKVSP